MKKAVFLLMVIFSILSCNSSEENVSEQSVVDSVAVDSVAVDSSIVK